MDAACRGSQKWCKSVIVLYVIDRFRNSTSVLIKCIVQSQCPLKWRFDQWKSTRTMTFPGFCCISMSYWRGQNVLILPGLSTNQINIFSISLGSMTLYTTRNIYLEIYLQVRKQIRDKMKDRFDVIEVPRNITVNDFCLSCVINLVSIFYSFIYKGNNQFKQF